MNKLITAVTVALFALAGTAVHAADAPAKAAGAKAGDKAASAAMAASAPAKKKEKKGGC
jgi:hypothetical protein